VDLRLARTLLQCGGRAGFAPTHLEAYFKPPPGPPTASDSHPKRVADHRSEADPIGLPGSFRGFAIRPPVALPEASFDRLRDLLTADVAVVGSRPAQPGELCEGYTALSMAAGIHGV
jgi:hypothetical protein